MEIILVQELIAFLQFSGFAAHQIGEIIEEVQQYFNDCDDPQANLKDLEKKLETHTEFSGPIVEFVEKNLQQNKETVLSVPSSSNSFDGSILLTWRDPGTQELQQKEFSLPLIIGRELAKMPDTYNGQPLSKAVFYSRKVSSCHAIIHVLHGELIITDTSTNGTTINHQLLCQSSQKLSNGDVLIIVPYQITVTLLTGDGGTEILTI